MDDLLDDPTLITGGAYTSVGYYDHTDIIKLVEAFGKHLFSALISKYPMLIADKVSALDMLESVDNSIHGLKK